MKRKMYQEYHRRAYQALAGAFCNDVMEKISTGISRYRASQRISGVSEESMM